MGEECNKEQVTMDGFKDKLRRVRSELQDRAVILSKLGPSHWFTVKRNGQNLAFFQSIKRDQAVDGKDKYLAEAAADPIPKIIWVYWAQGFDSVSPIVEACLARLKNLNPEYEIRALSEDSVAEWIDLSDAPQELPLMMRADLLRLRLMSQYGGVWIDATVWCHRPLDDWLPMVAMSGFFAFKNPHKDRLIENWFLASMPNHPLAMEWEKALTESFYSLKQRPPYYFWTMYMFERALRRSPDLVEAWGQVGSMAAKPTFLMASVLSGFSDASLLQSAIRRGLPLSKLTWKSPDVDKGIREMGDQVLAWEAGD